MYKKEIQRIKVDFNEILCDNFLGLSAVYHGFNYNKEYEMRGYTAADREVEYKRLKETRVKIGCFQTRKHCLQSSLLVRVTGIIRTVFSTGRFSVILR